MPPIHSICFKNFRVLHDCRLPLGAFTLIVGTNSCGKSTALDGLRRISDGVHHTPPPPMTVTKTADTSATITLRWEHPAPDARYEQVWTEQGEAQGGQFRSLAGEEISPEIKHQLSRQLARIRAYSFNPQQIAKPTQSATDVEMATDGQHMASVLDWLQNEHPRRFDLLNAELNTWFPEFERILITASGDGQRTFALRTRRDQNPIPANALSQGTLLALAILTLAHQPDPPSVIGIEEPDRGMHPRLLRHVRDALYRLSYPDQYGEDREPVQVVATTHSPVLLDLYRDFPEEVVIAERTDGNVRFTRLSDMPDYDRVIQDTPLGDALYSGILGGVPNQS